MDIEKQLEALDRIYTLFADFVAGRTIACGKGCAHCCTRNLAVTTLEGYAIFRHLVQNQRQDLLDRIEKGLTGNRFQPLVTTNQMADICMAGGDLPEEKSDVRWGNCHFLEDDLCPIYEVRPFSCRCMVSTKNCGDTGYADMEPLIFAVSTVFQQAIEHVDERGCSGNLVDVLHCLSQDTVRNAYEKNGMDCTKADLLPNRPLGVLMIPPEHREQIQPILRKLQGI